MKTKLLGLAIIASVFTLSCKKENSNLSSASQVFGKEAPGNPAVNVSVQHKVLAFRSSKDYNSSLGSLQRNDALFKQIDALNFNSLQKLISFKTAEADTSEPVFCDYLERILNEDNVVQIGDYMYCLDPKEEKVYVLPLALYSTAAYTHLINGDVDGSTILGYLYDDDVIDLVENGIKSEDAASRCSESGVGRQKAKQAKVVRSFLTPEISGQLWGKATYRRYGIFFELQAKVNMSCPDRSTFFHLTPLYYKIKCGGTMGYIYSWDNFVSNGSMGANNWTFQSYQGSKALNEINFHIIFMAKDENWFGNPDNPSIDLEIRINC